MSTKKLSRTVIEGGRASSNTWDRRNSHVEARSYKKNFINKVKQDVENWYDHDIKPTQKIYKEFDDKLGPMNRWLSSQCGKLWTDVRSDISKKFDTRTTAGRHIVYDHLLASVEEVPKLTYRRHLYTLEDWTTSYYPYSFYVDDAGILREKTVIRRKEKTKTFDTNKIANWLNGRVVGFVGDKAFWFVPVGKNKKHRGGSLNHKWTTQWGWSKNRPYYFYNQSPLRYLFLYAEPIYKKDKSGNFIINDKGRRIIIDHEYSWKDGSPSFRQDRKLNDKECLFWNSLPDSYRFTILKSSPTYIEPKGDKKPSYYY